MSADGGVSAEYIPSVTATIDKTKSGMTQEDNPHVYMDVSIGGQYAGRMGMIIRQMGKIVNDFVTGELESACWRLNESKKELERRLTAHVTK